MVGQTDAPSVLEDGNLLLPPHVVWAGLAVLHWVWPVWVLLTALSLAYVVWQMVRGWPASWGKRLAWIVSVILFGPFGLLAYLVSHRRRRRSHQVLAPSTKRA